MNYIIKLTIDTNAPGRVALDSIHRYATLRCRSFDASNTCCRPEEARVFRGFASARQWLIRHRLSSVDAMFMGLAGPTPSGPFTKWEIIPV
jgi:hypothetical protein